MVHVVRLGADLARDIRAFLAGQTAYQDLSELAEVALINQLALERSDTATGALDGTPVNGHQMVAVAKERIATLERPESEPERLASSQPSTSPLYSMTNRLFPLKVAARVLLHAPSAGMALGEYQECAGIAARAVGARLRSEDAAAGRKAADRRWIALPVGTDEQAALNRFAHHFTMVAGIAGGVAGPLPELGLGGLDDSGRPAPTDLGASLGMALNPVLDEVSDQPGSLLSTEERRLFISAIKSNPFELSAIREFVELVERHDGKQADVDGALAENHAGWSEAQCVAHRAAIVGRMHDLELASVDGRGGDAQVSLSPQVRDYLEE